MAVLPLRGKVVNAGKSTLKQVIENAEAQALFTAIGAGSGKDFNLDAARYGRIIILCDADVDGSHIRCLLLTLIYHYMRPLLEDGRVFAAQPPLYTVKVGDQVVHAFSDEHKAAAHRGAHQGQPQGGEPAVGPLQGPGRDGRRGAGGHLPRPRHPHPAAHHHGRRRRRRPTRPSCSRRSWATTSPGAASTCWTTPTWSTGTRWTSDRSGRPRGSGTLLDTVCALSGAVGQTMSDAGRLIRVDGPKLGHIPAFDGFRGLFVLQVVLYHALVTDFLEGSPIIIDWFFVASGFLITSLLLDERRATDNTDLRRFYQRRALRLFPAMYLMIAVATVILIIAVNFVPGRS